MSRPSMILFIGPPLPTQSFLKARLHAAGHQLAEERRLEAGIHLSHYMVPDIVLFHGRGPGAQDAGFLLRLRRPARMKNTRVVLLATRPTRAYVRMVAVDPELEVITETMNIALLERTIERHARRTATDLERAIEIQRGGGRTTIQLDRGWQEKLIQGGGNWFNSVLREGLRRETVILDISRVPLFDERNCRAFEIFLRGLPCERAYVIAGKNFGRLLENGGVAPETLFISREELQKVLMHVEQGQGSRVAL